MNRKRIFRLLLIFMLISIVSVLIINSRTPFFTPKAGSWSIGYAFYDSLPEKFDVQNGRIFSLEKMKRINPNTSLIADPFFVTKNDTIYLFFEYQSKKDGADIGVMKSVDGLDFKYDTIVLDEEFHLSYPNVFKQGDTYFMLPETKRANNVLLYKSYDFPYDWRLHDTLISNIKLKDPSIYLSDSLNILLASDDNLNLYLFESDSLTGKWKKKKQNSLLRFGTEARPAGRLFINKHKKICVPVQNCSRGYGYGLSLYELGLDKTGNYDFKLTDKFFLKADEQVPEFSGGMHHMDIQKYKDAYFVVYDGYSIKQNQTKFNWKFPLKATYLDTKNYFYQLLN